MSFVFFYPQFKKLTGAERLILKLAAYTARQAGPGKDVIILTHRFAAECRPALEDGVRLVETGWPMQVTGNHYLDAAVEYALGPALALRMQFSKLSAVIFFGPPSVPALWFSRRFLLPLTGRKVPILYFCFEPPRFIYSDTNDIVSRLGLAGRLIQPLFRLYRQIDRRMVRAAHLVLSNSPYGSQRIKDAYGRRAVVIEHGVDFTRTNREAVNALRSKLGLEGRKVAVTVNHLHPRKRIDLFLRSVCEASGQVDSVTGLVVGGGPERESLESLAGELGMKIGREVIFTGVVDENDLPAYYSLGNVYVHTAREESFGLSVIEALKLGLPVVSVNEGGPMSTVQDGVSGFLVEATPPSVGNALALLLRDEEKAKEMGAAGAAFVDKHFQWERGAATLLNLIGAVEARLAR
ncbi:MAG: glycosyltransferase family 4 protein [Chloroflexia bacterium]